MLRVTDRGSFAGIIFYLTHWEVKGEFHHETVEFVTDHPPEVRLYRKAAREFPVSGFVMEDTRALACDLLLKVCGSGEPKLLFLPQLGFVTALCTSFALSASESEPGVTSLEFLFKEKVDPPFFAGSGFLAQVENINDVINDVALAVISTLQVIAVTAYGVKRLADAAAKIDAIITSVNGLGLIPEPLGSVADGVDQMLALAKAPERFVHSLLAAMRDLPSEQAERVLTGVASVAIEGLKTLAQMALLPKLQGKAREKTFGILVDKLPAAESLRLMQLKPYVFDPPSPKWRQLPETMPSLLAAFSSEDLREEAAIIAKNDSVFACREVLDA